MDTVETELSWLKRWHRVPSRSLREPLARSLARSALLCYKFLSIYEQISLVNSGGNQASVNIC